MIWIGYEPCTSAVVSTLKNVLHSTQHFKLRDLGPTTQLLGIKIDRDWKKHSITISQHQYCLDILEHFGLADCKPISTPMQPNARLTHSQSPQTPEEVQFMKSVPYLAAVGVLMYLATTTRPDIAYTVFRSHLEMTVNTQLLLCNYLITDLGDDSQCTRGKAVQLQIKYLSR